MCLAVLALDQHPRYAVVLVSNRDEYHERPTAALCAWRTRPDGALIYSGRDLQAGGTWLALGESGRVALLTNVRRPWAVDSAAPPAPSRGQLPLAWLDAAATCTPEDFWAQQIHVGHSPFNLLLGDVAAGRWFWGSNVSPDQPGFAPQSAALANPGFYGLCNAALDTPWPKLQRLKQRVGAALAETASLPLTHLPTVSLLNCLCDALADRHQPADDTLPQTGVGLELERMLAPVFIHDSRGVYGTRASTVLLIEHSTDGRPGLAHMLERRFSSDAELLGQEMFSCLSIAATR